MGTWASRCRAAGVIAVGAGYPITVDELELQVLQQSHPRGLVLSVVGEVDVYSVSAFTTVVLIALGQVQADAEGHDRGGRCLVLDLRAVPFMDSAGLGALVGMLRRARQDRVLFSVVAPQHPVMCLLEVTGLGAVLPVWDDVASALAQCELSAAPAG